MGEYMKILLVDDEPDFTDLIHQCLFGFGFKVKAVNCSTEATSLIDKFQPDLIITDFTMPNENGVTFAERIRKNNQKVKFILLTGVEDIRLATDIEDLFIKVISRCSEI